MAGTVESGRPPRRRLVQTDGQPRGQSDPQRRAAGSRVAAWKPTNRQEDHQRTHRADGQGGRGACHGGRCAVYLTCPGVQNEIPA
jgi:hypothetical protein